MFEQFEGLPIQAAMPAIDVAIKKAAATKAAGINAKASASNETDRFSRGSIAREDVTAHDKDGKHDSHATSSPAAVGKATPVVPSIHMLDLELRPLSLSTACGSAKGSGLGLSREWADRLANSKADKRQTLSVTRILPGANAEGLVNHSQLNRGTGKSFSAK